MPRPKQISDEKILTLVRIADRKKAGHEFADTIVSNSIDSSKIRLGDIATIIDSFAETDSAAYLDGKRSIRVTAYRVGDETPRSVATVGSIALHDHRRSARIGWAIGKV